MKVKELVERLQIFNPETEVFLSKDEEGNAIKSIDECIRAKEKDGWELYLTGRPVKGVIIFPIG